MSTKDKNRKPVEEPEDEKLVIDLDESRMSVVVDGATVVLPRAEAERLLAKIEKEKQAALNAEDDGARDPAPVQKGNAK